jgi:hypothetical protein
MTAASRRRQGKGGMEEGRCRPTGRRKSKDAPGREAGQQAQGAKEESGDDSADIEAGECARARWFSRGRQAGERHGVALAASRAGHGVVVAAKTTNPRSEGQTGCAPG